MYSDRDSNRRFYVASYEEDIPTISIGTLIPKQVIIPAKKVYISEWLVRPTILLAFSVFLFATSIGAAGYSVFRGEFSVAAPIVYVQTENLYSQTPLSYGVQMPLSQPDFFEETRRTLTSNHLTFIEADLSRMELAYYEEGKKIFSVPIQAKGKEGSWWETPAGLYEIKSKEENHFSSFGDVYQPWSMAFQGNFFIHGWPHYPNGTPVDGEYSGGCIRLNNEDAETLFTMVKEGTPVLVYEKDFENDEFLYEPKIPELNIAYLIADIENSTVLASSDLNEPAPIASVVKLMTALVAAEYINLDTTVRISQEKYVTTLIPRLEGNYQASMYSLMQLLLVESSNEAAEVIASQIGRERFIELMNDKAKALGLQNTVFTDPSGLDDGNISTLSDLFRLVQYIFHNRSFILDLTADHEIDSVYVSGEFGELTNFNLIEGVDNFVGGKVGETYAAGQTSVTLHRITVNGVERILAVIVLGSDNRPEAVRQLLDYARERFTDA